VRIYVWKVEAMLARDGVTRAELSKRSGISRQSVSCILQRGTCSTVNAGKIARALGVDVTEIMEGVGA
jgi:lambda repressor-like predicted transcriptional regulator